MKKGLLLVVVVLGLVVAVSSDKYCLRLGPWQWSFAPDKADLMLKMERFLNDVKFKDFAHAALFHTVEDREKHDIPSLIEKKFLVKPEQLDIGAFEVLTVEVMETGDRAKVRTMVHVKLLNTKEDRDVDSIFYWKKVDGVWFMDLSSSL